MDFDLTCTTRLLYYDMEAEKRQLEAMTGVSLNNATGTGVTVDRTQAEYC